MVVHDQGIASLTSPKRAHPLKEYTYPEIGSGEELDMDSNLERATPGAR